MNDLNAGRRLRRLAIVAPMLLALSAAAAPAADWVVARGPSRVGFKVSHLIFSEVDGRFTRFSGSVALPGDSFEEARIEVQIDAASIRTGHRDRDEHLRGEEFLGAAEFPHIRFVSRSVRAAAGAYRIVGDLTIRDVTREIVLAARSMGRRETKAGPRLDFEATGSIDRRDYGLRWNRMWDGKALIGDQVEIHLEVCLVPTREAGPARQAGR